MKTKTYFVVNTNLALKRYLANPTDNAIWTTLRESAREFALEDAEKYAHKHGGEVEEAC
jgi:hypothetical protein